MTAKWDKLPQAVAWVSEHNPSHWAVITLIPSLPLPGLMRDSGRSCQGSPPSEPGSTTLPCPTSVQQLGFRAASTWQALAPSASPDLGSSEQVLESLREKLRLK